MATIHQPAPLFTLPDLEGALHSLEEQSGRIAGRITGRIALLNFWSAECSWCERTDPLLLERLREWGDEVALLTIASNANESRDLLASTAAARRLPLLLRDRLGQVADLYGAQTTPHLFLIDRDGILRYQGAFDDVTFRQRTPTQAYLNLAVEALLAGRLPDPAETPAYGCSIVRYPHPSS